MKIYKVVVNDFLDTPPEEAVYRGKKVKRGHAIFFASDKDLEKDNNEGADYIVMERADPLPELDLHGKKIVVHEA